MSSLVVAGPPVQGKRIRLGTGSQPHGGQRVFFGTKVVRLKSVEVPGKHLGKVNSITFCLVFQSRMALEQSICVAGQIPAVNK